MSASESRSVGSAVAIRERRGLGQFLEICPFSSQLKHLTLDRSGEERVWATLLVDGPRLLDLARALVSIGTGTLLKFLGALNELYWGRSACVDEVFCHQFWLDLGGGR